MSLSSSSEGRATICAQWITVWVDSELRMRRCHQRRRKAALTTFSTERGKICSAFMQRGGELSWPPSGCLQPASDAARQEIFVIFSAKRHHWLSCGAFRTR